MRIIFVSVGTSLFSTGLVGAAKAFEPLRAAAALEAWDVSATDAGAPELAPGEPEARLVTTLEALDATAGGSGVSELRRVIAGFSRRLPALRAAFDPGGDEAEHKLLAAELASLCRLLPRCPLAAGDRLVLLGSDSALGSLAARWLSQVLEGHPALDGSATELAWPRHWQAHDGRRLAERGAASLLGAVSRRLAADLRARPLFVLTAGFKLGIAILTQVSCWGQVAGADGLFLKLEDPGGVFFPPCRFVQRGRGYVLLPRLPAAGLRGRVRFTERLHEVMTDAEPPRGGSTPSTMLAATAGVGLVRAGRDLLATRFGPSSPLADFATWKKIDEHWQSESWDALRAEMRGAPSDRELTAASDGAVAQLRRAWDSGRTKDLPAELSALRSLWDDSRRPRSLLRGRLEIMLVATDSLTAELCASVEATFLRQVHGVARVTVQAIPGFHPFGGLAADGAYFTRLAEVLTGTARSSERLLIMPLGGTKLHLPLLTILASRLRAPMVLSHADLDQPVVIPWLESDGQRAHGTERIGDFWPELGSLPAVRLEAADG